MNLPSRLSAVLLAAFWCVERSALGAEIQRIWLTPSSADPLKLVVSWETETPGESVVEFGDGPLLGTRLASDESVTLHHVEIPRANRMAGWHYRVRTGDIASAVHRVQGIPDDVLRVAVISNAGYAKAAWGEAIAAERPHLLVTAGDNIPQLHDGQPVAAETTAAYSRLISKFPELFATTLFLPSLGNHDKEMRPRGPMPPEVPVYDVKSTAFRKFFALPEDEWKWHFDVPEFGVRFIALELSHTQDFATTWRTDHDYSRGSEQFEVVSPADQKFAAAVPRHDLQ
jgi:hypothetical protein